MTDLPKKDYWEDFTADCPASGMASTATGAEQPGARVAPFAVNQIIHESNDRLDHDLDLCVKRRVR